MKSNFALLVTAIILSALVTGCEPATNSNVSNANTANGNKAILVNSNQVANANANANKGNSNISREDFEREKKRYEEEAKKAGRKIGQGANDLWLWVKTRAALAYADDLRDSTIDVDVANDVVTLSGTVGNASQKSRAEQVAKGIEGVKKVQNKLVVKAAGSETNTNTGKKNANK